MAWARHEMEQLWNRIQKIDDLRNEKQQECFTEMAQNANNGKCHPR